MCYTVRLRAQRLAAAAKRIHRPSLLSPLVLSLATPARHWVVQKCPKCPEHAHVVYSVQTSLSAHDTSCLRLPVELSVKAVTRAPPARERGYLCMPGQFGLNAAVTCTPCRATPPYHPRSHPRLYAGCREVRRRRRRCCRKGAPACGPQSRHSPRRPSRRAFSTRMPRTSSRGTMCRRCVPLRSHCVVELTVCRDRYSMGTP
jgi:hypothetical protein